MGENAKLLNGYIHLVNKTVLFVQKYFEGIVPAGRLDQDIYWKTKDLYGKVEELREEGREAEAEELLWSFLEFANGYFEAGKPWETCRKDRKACRNTILNSVQLVANLTVLLAGDRDYPTTKVEGWLALDCSWEVHRVTSGYELPGTEQIGLVDLETRCI